jgi:O-methyltransferase
MSPTALYLDLMKRILANVIYSRAVPEKFDDRLRERIRREGGAWPRMAHTMIGFKRLSNLQFCVEDVIERRVPGDLIETGVWRGGACIFMRAILKAHGVGDRRVWVADSFEGLPRPSAGKYPADAGLRMHTAKALAVSVEEVKANFKEYGLLDEQVRFLKGWFRDSLPRAPIERLAVLRLDGDMYESTMDALVNLYPRLSAGGYVIVDDYGAVPSCRLAIEDFRREHGITEPLRQIDWSGVYWQRAPGPATEPLPGLGANSQLDTRP